MLKFQFALEQKIDESHELILNELKSGPYELIRDPDMKEIWKSEYCRVQKRFRAYSPQHYTGIVSLYRKVVLPRRLHLARLPKSRA